MTKLMMGIEECNGGEVPLLLYYCRRGHAICRLSSQSRTADEPAPAGSPRDLSHTQAAWGLGFLTESKGGI